MKKDIWVICDDLHIRDVVTLSLINKAYDLGCLNKASVTAVCIGKVHEDDMKSLFENGAEKVLYTELENPSKYEVSEVLKQMIVKWKPELIMFTTNPKDKYLAAVCSNYFEAGLTADCIDISLSEDGKYIFSRTALSDSVIAMIQCINTNIQMCTVKENAFQKKDYHLDFPYYVEKEVYSSCTKNHVEMEVLKSINCIPKEKEQNWLNAKIVFAIGRGVSGDKILKQIRELAEHYNAQVVGTRAVVEQGLIDKQWQVGQSGFSISPNIYVGFGVSGACQHIVGIKNAKQIIAINQDENAPIFQYADYKIVETIEAILENWMLILESV